MSEYIHAICKNLKEEYHIKPFRGAEKQEQICIFDYLRINCGDLHLTHTVLDHDQLKLNEQNIKKMMQDFSKSNYKSAGETLQLFLKSIKETSEELKQTYVEQNKKHVKVIIQDFASSSKQYSKEMIRNVQEEKTQGQFLLLFSEIKVNSRDVLHIVHNCRRQHAFCECRFNKFLITPASKSVSTTAYMAEDFEERNALLKSFQDGLNGTCLILVRSSLQTVLYELFSKPNSAPETGSQDTGTPHTSSSEQRQPPAEHHKPPSTNKDRRGHKRKNNYDFHELVKIVEDNICVPVEKVNKTSLWLADDSLCKVNEKRYYEVIHHVEEKLLSLRTEDLRNFLNNANNPCFQGYLEGVNKYYCGRSESVETVTKLLHYQFPEPDAFKKFIKTLYNVLNRTNDRRNTILFVGEPDSLSIKFVNMVASAMVSVVFLSSISSGQYRFSACARKRLIVINKPTVDPKIYSELQNIFNGENVNIKVKKERDYTLTKTPVLICNSTNIFKGPPWTDAIVRYSWNKCNFTLNRQLHPMAMYDLFDKYSQYLS